MYDQCLHVQINTYIQLNIAKQTLYIDPILW